MQKVVCQWCRRDVGRPGFVCLKEICPTLDPFEPPEEMVAAKPQTAEAERKTDDEPQPSASHE